MKKILGILIGLSIGFSCLAQTPVGFSYQVVLRNSSGQVIGSQTAQLRVTLISSNGLTTHYQEVHDVTSSAQGLINIIIGNGTSKVGVLADVPWGNDQITMKTEIKVGSATTYTELGSQPLQAVPYALYANNAKEVESSPTATDEEPIFVVKNKLGQIVFAVYQEGVRVFVDDGTTVTKGTKGGFAVGGLSGTKQGVEYFRITPDSARIYIDDSGKGTKGGFAVGGLSGTKSDNNFFNVSTDATGIINPSQNRVLWYPLRNAFLVGRVLVEHPDSVGTNSFASGYESKAKGDFSQAMGFKAIARGAYAMAIGKNALAQGNSSFAFGDGARTSTASTNSFAIGRNTEASANNSFAFGNGAIATAVGSFAFGAGGRDSTGASLAISTEAAGLNSFAFGLGAKAYGLNSFSIGTGTTTSNTGENATAMGFGTVASGRFAVAIGFRNIASGRSSTAWGGMRYTNIEFWNVASGDASTAWGYDTRATGISTTTWGASTKASNQFATAWGYHSEANGFASTAWGWSSKAQEHQSTAWAGAIAVGSHSTAASWTKANSYMSFVIGRANDTIYTNSAQYYSSGKPTSYMDWVNADPLFIVGNGMDHPAVGKSNALTVLKDGTTIIGWNTSVVNSTSNPDARYILSVKNPRDAGYKFYVHGNAGGTGSWNTTSDARLKKNIKTIESPLSKLLKLRGVSYEWLDETKPGKQIGFIAQETLEVLPEVVTGTEQTTYSMQYAPITALLVEAIKEQQKLIEELQNKNSKLEEKVKEIDNLKAELETIKKLLTK